MAGAFFETGQFAGAIAHRSAHLPGQFGDDVVGHRRHRVGHRRAQTGALGNRGLAPCRLGRAGAGDGLGDRRVIGQRALGVDRAVDRRGADKLAH